MLEERSLSTALAAGPPTMTPNTSTCTSAKETAPGKTPSFRLRGRPQPSQDKGDTAWRSAEEMEPSM